MGPSVRGVWRFRVRLPLLLTALALWVALPAAASQVVDVRIGEHPDFTRVVFELDGRAGYKVERNTSANGTELTVTLDASSAGRKLSRRSSDVRTVEVTGGEHAVVRIHLSKGNLALKEMILSNPYRVVLDVMRETPAVAVKAAPKPTPKPVAAVEPKPEPKPEVKPETKPEPAPKAEAKVEPPKPAPKVEPSKPPSPTPTPVAKAPEPKPVAKAEPKPAPVPEAKAEPVKPGLKIEGKVEPPKPVADVKVEPPKPAPAPTPSPVVTADAKPAPKTDVKAAPTPVPAPPTPKPDTTADAKAEPPKVTPAPAPTPVVADTRPPQPPTPAKPPAPAAPPPDAIPTLPAEPKVAQPAPPTPPPAPKATAEAPQTSPPAPKAIAEAPAPPPKRDARTAAPAAPEAKPATSVVSRLTNPISLAVAGLALVGVVAFLLLLRRRALPNDLDVTAIAEDRDVAPDSDLGMATAAQPEHDESSFAGLFDDDETRAPARESAPLVRMTPPASEPAPTGTPLDSLFDEDDAQAPPARQGAATMSTPTDLPMDRTSMGAARGAAPARPATAAAPAAGGDVMRLVQDLERRLGALESKLDQANEAREKLERQVAAQSEELRVQRAAIARTQRALRTMSRGDEEKATEPALREETQTKIRPGSV